MVGNRIGFIALCNKDEEISSFTSYHCIIDQQVLCSKILKSNDIMQIAFKIVNSIRSRSLQRRQFRELLEETESAYGDLLLHTDVRWLSHGVVLKRFRIRLPEIKKNLQMKEEHITELEEEKWLMKLAFFSAISLQNLTT
ncbi:uncharacterized protein TNCV_2327171 [Trichonephila clavipes]|nr:uncharacterized protein TNCV_2327171 [Trichonephila clavipes]